jgi:serine protease AprX
MQSVRSLDPASIGLTQRSLKRRSKSLPADRLLDVYDLPVSPDNIKLVQQTGALIRSTSRWLNAVAVEATEVQMQLLRSMPECVRMEKVAHMRRAEPDVAPKSAVHLLEKTSTHNDLDYGRSAQQLSNMRVIDLHRLGINGHGVLVCMIDDGFNNYRLHAALKNIHVDSTYDFIHNIADVNRQPWELSIQGNHGAGTLSAIGGYDSGNLIGAAYGATFLLAKTEMDSSGNVKDFNSEEDTYVAALEWAERQGADITSSSLGYKEFWGTPNYATQDLDGRTTKVARAAVIAARKGVLVVTAMGNEGYEQGGKGAASTIQDSTLISPADADSILSVGAAASDGILATFSGCGPTADGRIKPEVVAQGMAIYWADGTTIAGYQSVQGTSCSTPLVAGAAALIFSLHPELTNMQVRDALMRTAKHISDGRSQTATYPNNYYGYGFVDAYAAAQSVGPIIQISPTVQQNYPNPFNGSTVISFTVPSPVPVELAVYNLLGQRMKLLFSGDPYLGMTLQWDGTDERGKMVASGIYFARLKSLSSVSSIKMLYLK